VSVSPIHAPRPSAIGCADALRYFKSSPHG
jgi:hypothetical protein